MIVGVGSDLVDIRRLQRVYLRYSHKFVNRILSEQEQELLPLPLCVTTFLAGRWAAKEALLKALGCGLVAPLSWRQIAVLNDSAGKPFFSFSETMHDFLAKKQIKHCHLSISHDGNYALATVITEGGS